MKKNLIAIYFQKEKLRVRSKIKNAILRLFYTLLVLIPFNNIIVKTKKKLKI